MKKVAALFLALALCLSLCTVAFAAGSSFAITNGTPESAKETNHGYIAIDKATATDGETVTVTVTPAEGYQLKSLTATPTVVPEIRTIADVLATAEGGFPTSSEKAWPGSEPNCCYIAGNNLSIGMVGVKVISLLLTTDVSEDGDGDSFTCSDNNVTFTFNMTEGKLTSIEVQGPQSGLLDGTYAPLPGTPSPSLKPITLTKQTDGTYQFTMPGYAVTVTAVFEKIPTIADIIATYENFPLTKDEDLYWTNDQGTTCYYYSNNLFFRYTGDKSLMQSMTVSVAEDGKNYTYSVGTVTYTFIMDDSGVLAAIKVSGSTDIKYNGTYGAPPTKYTVTNGTTDMNGNIAIDKASAAEGETVTITVTPDEGYELKADSLKVYKKNTVAKSGPQALPITPTQDAQDKTKYTFTMPDYAVIVTAVFEENSGTGGGNPNPGHGYSAPSGHLVTSDLTSVTKVTVDGKVVDSKYYTVSGGNVTLTDAFMKTLANGKHTVKLYNGDVVATGTMTVSGNAAVVSAKTADAGIALYGVLSVSSLLGMGWVSKKKH